MKTRDDLIKDYYTYSPRECEDLIDLDYEKNRIETMPIEELEKEVEFYYQTYQYTSSIRGY